MSTQILPAINKLTIRSDVILLLPKYCLLSTVIITNWWTLRYFHFSNGNGSVTFYVEVLPFFY